MSKSKESAHKKREFTSKIMTLYEKFHRLFPEIIQFHKEFSELYSNLQMDELFRNLEKKRAILNSIVDILNKLDLLKDIYENDVRGVEYYYNLILNHLEE